jgi:hypothetical protein
MRVKIFELPLMILKTGERYAIQISAQTSYRFQNEEELYNKGEINNTEEGELLQRRNEEQIHRTY